VASEKREKYFTLMMVSWSGSMDDSVETIVLVSSVVNGSH
jgi:hypothetical protein